MIPLPDISFMTIWFRFQFKLTLEVYLLYFVGQFLILFVPFVMPFGLLTRGKGDYRITYFAFWITDAQGPITDDRYQGE